MSKVTKYSMSAKKIEQVDLPKEFLGEVNIQALAQAVRVVGSNAKKKTSLVKTRSDVRASTRKIYKQKGTGRARHGARSAPIFVGGGITHGPTGKKRILSISKKLQKIALKSAFVNAANSKKVFLLGRVSNAKKTKEAAEIIDKIRKDTDKKRLTLVLSEKSKDSKRLFRNIEGIFIEHFKNLNAYKIFFGGNLVFDTTIFENEMTSKTKISAEKASTKTKMAVKKTIKDTKKIKTEDVKK